MNEVTIIDEEKIENMIYEIRRKQVMLVSDLAKLYHCVNGTKDINKAVKRNLNQFPSVFYFQLTFEECSRFQFGTLNVKRGYNIKYLPYVFTEQGVAMLASVLHSEVAAQMSISIMRAFVAIRYLIGESEYRLSNIESKVLEHDTKINLLQELFNKFEEKKKVNEIYFDGQIYDAYSKIQDIFKSANKELIIIDGYADNTILDIVKRLNIDVTIITKPNNLLTLQDINKYNLQYSNLRVLYDNTFHDRYFILDETKVYHCGSSINRIGYRTFSITMINDLEVCKLLKNKVNNIK